MVFKAILQKERLKQSLLKVTLEAAVADVLQDRSFRNFTICTGKHLCWSLFLIKLRNNF